MIKDDTPIKSFQALPVMCTLMLFLCACSLLNPSPREQELKAAQRNIIATDERAVANCRYLGSVHGRADPRLEPEWAVTDLCKDRARRHAAEIGATHIVWLYMHQSEAAALAYDCDQPPQ